MGETIVRQPVARKPVIIEKPPLDWDALHRTAHEDAIAAYRTRLDRAALVGWLAMLVLVCAFLAAVGVSVVLDATGLAF
jgi:hypothetical protein